jgi:hypothetical protein
MSMKNFINYLMDSEKSYEFRIKIANIDPTEKMEQLENALEAFRLDSISKPKRLPIKESDIDFPAFKNCQLFLMDVVLKYPCNNDQLRAVVAERACIPAANIVVVPKNHPEEYWRWNENGESELREYVQGEAVLDKPYEDNPEAKAAGDAYASFSSILKELNAVKQEVAEGAAKTEAAKTTNELPQGDVSPVGSKQNKIPAVKGTK